MQEQLEQRLNDLKTEFEAGQKTLAELDAKQSNLSSTLMRFSDAIQVLEEELAIDNGDKGEIAAEECNKAAEEEEIAGSNKVVTITSQ